MCSNLIRLFTGYDNSVTANGDVFIAIALTSGGKREL